eukprot:jgi/Psemu1/178214/e_gw1.3.228.1
MSKPRPGVAAAKRLSKSTDPKLWALVGSQYTEIVPRVKGLETTEMKPNDTKLCLSKDELLTVVAWKFSVGKPRHALMNHLRSNTEATVREHSSSGISIATARETATNKSNVAANETKKALQALMNLKGVGPATASAVLALARPDVFAYMYDEAIDCFMPKRTYTLPTYMAVNERCLEIAEKLGDGWTTSRVATTLWTAARVSAYDLDDHTLKKRPVVDSAGTVDDETTTERRRASKRQKCDPKMTTTRSSASVTKSTGRTSRRRSQ